jgi:hypothetical protein
VTTDVVQLLSVDWADPRAVSLRAAMDEEIMPRYADRFDTADPDAACYERMLPA